MIMTMTLSLPHTIHRVASSAIIATGRYYRHGTPRRRRFHSSTSSNSRGFELSSEWIRPKAKTQNDNNDNTLIVCLHGLLGNKRNVKSFTNAVCQSLGTPGLLLDVRGHGASQLPAHLQNNLPTKTTWDDCVADVQLTLNNAVPDLNERELILMGHSMGGRVTMNYALASLNDNDEGAPTMKRPAHIWLLDTVPGSLSPSVLNVMNVAQGIVDDNTTSTTSKTRSMKRNELTQHLVQEKGLDLGTAQWLASGFDTQTQQFQFDLQVAQDLVQAFDKMDYLDWIQRGRAAGQFGIHMVRGGANQSWEQAGCLNLMEQWERDSNDSQQFSFHTLPRAGHWVHIDDPKGLVAAVESIHKKS